MPGEAAYPYVNWGVGLVDFDNDGDKDLFLANGHLQDNVDLYDDSTAYEARNILLMNQGDGRFVNVSDQCGDGLLPARSSRGTGFDDLDGDGDGGRGDPQFPPRADHPEERIAGAATGFNCGSAVQEQTATRSELKFGSRRAGGPGWTRCTAAAATRATTDSGCTWDWAPATASTGWKSVGWAAASTVLENVPADRVLTVVQEGSGEGSDVQNSILPGKPSATRSVSIRQN